MQQSSAVLLLGSKPGDIQPFVISMPEGLLSVLATPCFGNPKKGSTWYNTVRHTAALLLMQ